MKKIYSIMLSLSIGGTMSAFAAWNGNTEIWSKGDGSQNSPFLIENEAQLAHFQATVTAGEAYEGKFFRLAANLDMAGRDFAPIGFYDDYTTSDNPEMVKNSKVFLGTFDGDYHTIDNLSVHPHDTELGGAALFAVSYPQTTIKNLYIGAGSVIEGAAYDNVGAIVGFGSGGTIENCCNMGTVKGGSFCTGGIVGIAEHMSISGCVNKGVVSGHSYSGGIAGQAYDCTVTSCYSTGKIDCPGAFLAAGIVGWALESTSLSNCYATGEVDAAPGSSWLAGKSPICGELENATASNCYYVEALTGCKPITPQAGVEAVTESDLRSAAMADKLNAELDTPAWAAVSNGFPMLLWETGQSGSISNVAVEKGLTLIQRGENLIIGGTGEAVAISIFDAAGRTIIASEVSRDTTIHVPAKGTFIVVAIAADGTKTTQKFIF